MTRPIADIASALCKELPYTKACEEVRIKMEEALEQEYERLRGQGISELQALGELMCRYGTMTAAAELAGISRQEIEALLGQKSTLKKKSLKRMVFRMKISAATAAVGAARGIMYLVQAVLLREPAYLVSVMIDFFLAYLTFLPYRKYRKKLSYDTIVLDRETKETFDVYSDRYKKRLINTIFLEVGFFVNFSGVWEQSIVSNMSSDEFTALVSGNLSVVAVGLFLLLYQICMAGAVLSGICAAQREIYRKEVRKTAWSCGIFLAVLLLAVPVLRMYMRNPFWIIYLLTTLFMLAGLTVHYGLRAKYVIRQIRINPMRVVAFSMVGIVLVSVYTMQKSTYLLQPYIATVSEVPHVQREIRYDEETGVYSIAAGEEDFKILHLTDIHLGGSLNSLYKDYQALHACYKLIEHTRPDFVIVTGDLVFPMGVMSFSLNNEAPVMQFAGFMRNIGIPWAFTYGNHDTEHMATGTRETIGKLYETLSFKNSGSLLYPYVQPEITGRNNQIIRLENTDGSVRQALFLLDSNDYTGAGVNDYDYIHEDQVNWYEAQVKKLSRVEGRTVPSMLFFHIPLQEYRTAYELYQQGSSQVQYYFGTVGEKMIDQICCSDYPSNLFARAAALESTKAMFCGHDHYNNISLEYEGIRLTYGMSIDYLAMPGIDKDTSQRGAELIAIHPDGAFDISQVQLSEIE